MKLLSNIIGFVLIVSTFISSSVVEINPTETLMNTCRADDDVCTLNYSMELKPWIHELYMRTVTNRRYAEEHPFIAAISAGEIPRTALLKYFEGMYWHVARSGHLFINLASRRPASVAAFISSIGGRVSDGHSSEDAKRATEGSFRALMEALGGDFDAFRTNLDSYQPPYEWFLHNAQLRAAIYSADFSWEVGTAAMSAGTEGTVPWYCAPLARALEKGYGIKGVATEWLRVRGIQEAKEHADNGFKVLSHFIEVDDVRKISECSMFVDRLSISMSHTLLDCGLRLAAEEL